jgi:hypothetical protein
METFEGYAYDKLRSPYVIAIINSRRQMRYRMLLARMRQPAAAALQS